MDRIVKKTIWHKIISVILVFVMVIGMFPVSSLQVKAEEPEGGSDNVTYITITVKDEEGNAVEGATVDYKIEKKSGSTRSEAFKTVDSEAKTDTNGVANICDVSKFVDSDSNFIVDELAISATISKDGYKLKTLGKVDTDSTESEKLIERVNQNFAITLEKSTASPKIEGVTIEVLKNDYTGDFQDLITSVTTDTKDVTIEYSTNYSKDNVESAVWSTEMPQKVDVGKYSVYVRISKDGYETYLSEQLTAEIKAIDINDISIEANDLYYISNEDVGVEQELVTLTGEFQEEDTVTWYLNNEKYEDTDTTASIIPKASAIGEYKVKLVVNRGSNYKELTLEETVIINNPLIDCMGITIQGLKSTYTGEEQAAVTVSYSGVENSTPAYTLKYQLGDAEDGFKTDDSSWTTDIPKVTDAGSYIVWVKAVQKNYSDTAIPVIPAEGAVSPYNVLIDKAEQHLTFTENDYNTETSTKVLKVQELLAESKKTFNFAAKEVTDIDEDSKENTKAMVEATTGNISYAIELDEGYETIATIDENGILTVCGAGKIVVKATLAGDDNYRDCSITHILHVLAEKTDDTSSGEFVRFTNSNIEYVLGNTAGIPNNTASKVFSCDNGEVTYSIKDGIDSGFSIDDDGTITVVNYRKVLSLIEQQDNETYIVTITASKAESEESFYPADFATYTLSVTLAELPASPYTVYAVDDLNTALSKENGRAGWYNTAVRVVPVDNYKIIRIDDTTLNSNEPSFSEYVTFGDFVDNQPQDQGENKERTVYLQNITSGEITKKVVTMVKNLDSVKPSMLAITFPDTDNIFDGEKYYKDVIEITFIARDVTSGVDAFHWTYKRAEGSSTSILELDSGEVEAELDTEDESKTTYIGKLKLPKEVAEQLQQLRGSIEVYAVDVAGNDSDSLKDAGIFTIDTKSPQQNVTLDLGKYEFSDDSYYISHDVTFTFVVTEANFFDRDIVFISKDGKVAEKQHLEWTSTENQDEYMATLTLSDDAEYVVSMEYVDRAGNVMPSFTSNKIVIDKISPIIEFDSQSVTIKVTERNFNASSMEVLLEAEDICGDKVVSEDFDLQEYLRTCEWEHDGDIHTVEISEKLVDAVYDLKLNCKDLAGTAAKEYQNSFVLDRTAPDVKDMSISYSNSITDTILSLVTLGFYQSEVTVTFTACDSVSGVNYFIVDYQRQNGVSTTNVEKYTDIQVDAEQDTADKKKFTGSIKLPKQATDQLRGSIGFTSTDTSNNTSDKLTDENKVIVVDSVAPTLKVEYTEPDNVAESKNYYKKSLTATLTVTEANFFEEDVIVKIQKNDGNFETVNVTWDDLSTDVHRGTYTIEASNNHLNDGDYVFYVEYKDKSNNQMESYTSDIKVVDTTIPVIKVSYSNNSPSNTLSDSEGHDRKYFSSAITATVSIIERNFSPDDVKFMIDAKDVAGNVLNANSLHTKSSWKTNGDNHTIIITYPGDANYTFDVEYTDLAKLEAVDYAVDYFTVDTTNPTDLEISYSTSVLDTILLNASFGFYNAKTNVTITAKDTISSINSFKYSYVNADGVSSVNAELIDEIITEAGIDYSDNGVIGTSVFDIPKDVLGATNQFNGNVNFNATDRANNESEYLRDVKRIVVDNITPTATIQYNTPVQEVNGISYYDGDISATITINEANFYSEDVNITVTRDGAASTVEAMWIDQSTDIHIGTFTLTGDADYTIEIAYTDKSSNVMEQYISPQMTIDTEIIEATITINGQDADGMAFKDDVIPAISFEDKNFESYKVTLLRTSFADKNVDVTEKFVAGHVKTDVQGGSGSFDTFEKNPDNDGIYTMTVELKDKAGHIAEKNVTFTVNRYGSVYEYNDYLVSLIVDGGAYVQAVDHDLVITEYNPDRLLSDSLDIEISKDGKPLDESNYTVAPEINDVVALGQSGWFQYEYVIDKENFDSDGVYKIAISSKDATGNTPENINYEDKEILFRVDSTVPEITSITGLEDAIVNATEQNVKYSVFDAMGLESVIVYVNESEILNITNFEDDINNYTGEFKLEESSSAQTVRIVVKDIAGNITDTASEEFTSSYVFNDSVTVSTNALIRWYANKTLFYSSIIGSSATISGCAAAITFFKRRRLKFKKTE